MKRFVDETVIMVRGGHGGDGAVSFRREKFVPKGGPDGGDGGKGGDIYFVVDTNASTLLDFQRQKQFRAQNGLRGGKKNKTGASGDDVYLQVPKGTIVYEEGSNDKIADLVEAGQTICVAKGGDGGKGNTRFKSSTNQAPRTFTPGEEGEEKRLRLELKILADIGIIGFPNAGKSTLLSVLTNANPSIANYRFTTLEPNLGVMYYKNQEIVLADLPGLIEGAAEGKGLGDEFLKHVERTRVLLHVIDPVSAAEEVGKAVSIESTYEAYLAIRNELNRYSEALYKKLEIIVINKIDIPEVANISGEIESFFRKKNIEKILFISAASQEGIDLLQQQLILIVTESKKQAVQLETSEPTYVTFTIDDIQHLK